MLDRVEKKRWRLGKITISQAINFTKRNEGDVNVSKIVMNDTWCYVGEISNVDVTGVPYVDTSNHCPNSDPKQSTVDATSVHL